MPTPSTYVLLVSGGTSRAAASPDPARHADPTKTVFVLAPGVPDFTRTVFVQQ